MDAFRTYIRHGLLAGLAGGAAAAVVLVALGERSISRAIELETAAARAAGEPAGDELFSRTTQIVGGALGTALVGAALGLVFATVFAAVRHRLAARDDWRRAVNLAAVAFVALYLVPWLKYPANPPAVGDPDTIGQRTALYLVMVAWSAVAAWAAWRLLRHLRSTGAPDHVRTTLTAAVWAAIVVLGLAVLPPNPDAVGAPAQLVWRFRLASLAGSAAFWSVCGAVFGWLRLRYSGRSSSATATASTVSATAPTPPPKP
jgi:predicted cobalt transporter CbtA